MQPARRCLARRLTAAARVPHPPHPHQYHQRRAYSESSPPAVPPPRRTIPSGPSPCGITRLTSRRLISVSGPDAAKFLQGLITANLFPAVSPRGGAAAAPPPLRADLGFAAAFLSAKGRVLADVFVYRDVRPGIAWAAPEPGEAWLVEVDAREADALCRTMTRYKLRAKVEVRVCEEGEGDVWHAWGADEKLAALPPTDTQNGMSCLLLRDPRAPALGYRLLTFPGASPLTTGSPFPLLPRLSEDAYRLHRYLAGVPEGQDELLRDAALPHESNMDAQARADGLGALDFRKGCYTGQELTIRTQHRGVVRKRVLPCVLYPYSGDPEATEWVHTAPRGEDGGVDLAALYRPEIGVHVEGDASRVDCGAAIERIGGKGKDAGKWLRGVGNVGLAVCRLESMTDVVLPGEALGEGFRAKDEFAVELGKTEGGGVGGKVKVIAFVPAWLREFLAQGKGKGEGH